MGKEFIRVKTITGYHIIRISEIIAISPNEGRNIKSSIRVRKGDDFFEFYSTEEQTEIYNKL